MTLKPASSVTVWTALRDVADRVAEPRLLDPGLERRLARVEQALRLGRDRADRERPGRVGDEAVERHADVDGEDVAVLRASAGPGIPWTTIAFGERQVAAG